MLLITVSGVEFNIIKVYKVITLALDIDITEFLGF